MSMQFQIEWEDSLNDTPEVCRTSGALRIEANGHSLTRNENDWSQSVNQSVRLSAYPLALWLASSWWRLRWEPLPIGDRASTSWRMAHEVAAAGYGYLWPQLVFSCDGERMNYWSIASTPDSNQPIRYLSNEHDSVGTAEFEQAVDAFVALAIERLDAFEIASELKGLWAEVLEERADPGSTHYRKLEAILGFEPDEADASVVERFVALGEQIGRTTMSTARQGQNRALRSRRAAHAPPDRAAPRPTGRTEVEQLLLTRVVKGPLTL